MSKSFKKVLLVSLLTISLSFAFVLTGCNKKDKDELHIGICQLVQHEALDEATKGFKEELTRRAELAGKKIVIDEQNAQGDSNACVTIINQFVTGQYDLIMANATPALQAAYNGTTKIPVLGTSITEYGVALGIENFNGVVGGNVSGTSDLAPLVEQANMILEFVPDAKKVGLLYCSAEANSKYQVDVIEAELVKKGLTVTKYSFGDSNDLSSVCTLCAQNSDVMYIPTDNTAASNATLIDSICRPLGVPIIAGEESLCAKCGIATLSISYYNIGVKTAEMAAKILFEGEDISKMEVGYDQNPVKKYNEEICFELGIQVPEGYTKIGD